MSTSWFNHPGIMRAASTVLQGGVIAYPTEAVWGLGCDPFNHHAGADVLALKQRDPDKGLILVAADIAQFDFLTEPLSDMHQNQLRATWPGHHTWLVPHNNRVPSWVTGKFDTVAIRVSAHPVVQALCHRVGGPIVSTSANRQGKSPARTSYRARVYFGDAVTYSPGRVGSSLNPSRISHLLTGEVIR